MQERRTTVRVGCFLPAQYSLAGDTSVWPARITNLSLQGLRLLASQAVSRERPVTVHFTLPSEEAPVTVRGMICWEEIGSSREGGHPIGLCFTGLDDTTRFCLQAFIAAQCQAVAQLPGRLARTWTRLQRRWPGRLPNLSGAVMAGLLGAAVGLWIFILQGKAEQLRQTLTQRTRLLTQLAADHQHVQGQLSQATAQTAALEIRAEGLQYHAAQLEAETAWLAQHLAQTQQAYEQVRREREAMIGELARLDQERALLAHRLQSLPDLRAAIQEATLLRQQQLRAARRQQVARLRETDRRVSATGNHGYLIRQGQPTPTASAVTPDAATPMIVRVHAPEVTDLPAQ